jgi:tetratricopeptide (TPR) repeat protein
MDIDVGNIVLTPFPNADPGVISLNSLSAPRDAREAYLKARKELDKPKPNADKATKELRKAVARYDNYASAWQLLGEIYDRQKDESRARESFEKAISADPKYVTPYISLGNILLRNQSFGDLGKLSKTVLEVNPDNVEAHYFQAVSCYALRDFEEAEKAARYVLDKNRAHEFASVHLILGDILAQRGEIVPAASQLRSFLILRPQGQNAERARDRLRNWEQQGVLPKQ